MTITNSLNVFGGGPPSLWNSHLWNSFKWGEGTVAIPHSIVRLISVGSISPDSARYFSLTKLIEAGEIAPDSSRGFDFVKLISETLGFTSSAPEQELTDPEGYYHLFPGGVANAHNRVNSTYSTGAAGSTTWSQSTASSTSWSAL